MDLTPQTLRDVEFREKLRGYHPDDVDDFLESVAVAVEGLLGRLHAAETAASAVADGSAAPVAPSQQSPAAAGTPAAPQDVTEDTLRRTLLLAQRTADAAVADAEDAARRMVETATSEAKRITAEAEAKVAMATREARARTESAVADLEQRKIGLEREVAALQAWATQQRDRLRDVLSDQIRALDIWLATSGTPRPLSARSALTSAPAAPSEPSDASGSGERLDDAAPPTQDPPSAAAAEQDGADSEVEAGQGVGEGGEGDSGGARLGGRLFRRP